MSCAQDCVALVPPYPYYLDDPLDFDLQDGLENNKVWYGQLRLMFTCEFRPTRGKDRKIRTLNLALITTFEDFPMQYPGLVAKADKVNRILYEPTPVPCIYVVPVENILCRAPLFPCYLHGNAYNTVPCTWPAFSASQAKAGMKRDSAPRTGQGATRTRGSRLFQVNTWMWHFGRPVQRSMSVSKAEERRGMVWAARAEAIANSKREKKKRRRLAEK